MGVVVDYMCTFDIGAFKVFCFYYNIVLIKSCDFSFKIHKYMTQ